MGKGGILLAFYSAGLAVPFLLTAVAFSRATTAFRWLRDRYLLVTAVSGCVLIAMGVLLFTGELQRLNIDAQNALDGLGLNFFSGVAAAASAMTCRYIAVSGAGPPSRPERAGDRPLRRPTHSAQPERSSSAPGSAPTTRQSR